MVPECSYPMWVFAARLVAFSGPVWAERTSNFDFDSLGSVRSEKLGHEQKQLFTSQRA